MMTSVRAAAAVLMAVALSADTAGQAPVPRAAQPVTASTTAILVDVVVRDGRGRPVTTLGAADFEIAEDGVRQTIGSFSRVSRGGGIGVGVAWRSPRPVTLPAATATASEPVPLAQEDATTALVFDHLSAETLRLAQKATLDYVPLNGASSIQVGVFATDVGVRAIQRYTTDRTQIRRAVSSVLPVGMSDEELRGERSDDLAMRKRTLSGVADAAGSGAAAGGGAALAQNAAQLGERENELRLVQTEINMLRSIENSDRGRRGYDTSAALMAVVRSLAEYPGRKTVVFFSEGLPVSPSLSARLDLVIDAANRANVTVYAVDTKGLRAKSTNERARKELDAFAEDRRSQIGAGADRTEQPLSMAMERVEDTLRLDSRAGLARLASDTGGFLVEGSNDLSSAFRRIDEDTQFHYLLTYSPSNDALDGRFRAIRVKVDRPGVQVFARKGYRALSKRPPGTASASDIPALALLDRAPLPNAFPVQAAGFSFPDPARPGLSPLLVHVSTASLHYDVDAARATYSGRAVVAVRLIDAAGQEAQTLSQEYILSGDVRDLEAAKKGEILFYREPELAPGVYTMEAAVLDPIAHTGSARVSTLTVPAAEPAALGMSSLVLVSRAEETGEATPVGGPLYVGRTLLYPNLGEPIRKSAGAMVSFYFALYGDPRGATARADLLRHGQLVATTPLQLPAATGARVQHVGRLPVGELPPGTYELRIQILGAGTELSRTAYFTIAE